jgi:polyphosphate kinase
MNTTLIPRDISWLSFNHRVLQEANDKTVPLIERLKFLGIFSNNLDEFFRVRVASIKREEENPLLSNKNHKQAHELIEQITDRVIELQDLFEQTYTGVEKELEQANIFIVNENNLTPEQQQYVRNYFFEKIRMSSVPIMLNSAPNFPYLKDRVIYLAVKLHGATDPLLPKEQYSIIELPTELFSRFVKLPNIAQREYIILLDDVIRYCLKDIFAIFNYKNIEAYTLKVTRDAELELDNDLSKSYTEKLTSGIKKRKRGKPVRINYDEDMPKDLLNYLVKKLRMKEENNVIPGGRYHNFRNFMNFPTIGASALHYPSLKTLAHVDFIGQTSLLNVIERKDVLLTFPYHNYGYVTDILREAAIDPHVESIKITLYRIAENSSIAYTLLNAIKNGKRVYVVLELQARFDEENNIYWANKLQEAGAIVRFGIPGLKVHSKLFIITKKVADKQVQIASIGTGNFNENTARVYTDYSLLTANKAITTEVDKVFNFFQINYQTGTYTQLLVAPFYMRNRFEQLIDNEIKAAKANKPASLFFKLNNMEDHGMIQKLYDASNAGVNVKLIVRGICCLVPGIKNQSENITVISVIDQYLEHSRVYCFGNGGKELMYISSADIMSRNLDERTEVACPIVDESIKKEIKTQLDLHWNDNVKARVINYAQANTLVKNKRKKVRSQLAIYVHLQQQLSN